MLRRSSGSDRADPLALDARTAERPSPGCPAPTGAQPTAAGETRPLPGANGEPGADGPAGQAAVTAPLVVVGAPSRSPVVTPARAARTRRRQLKAAAAVAIGALAVAGAAAAISLGEPAQRTAPTDAGIAAPTAQGGGRDAAGAGPTAAATEPAALKELCQAYRDAGLDAAALRVLAAAAGGAGKVAAWCQAVTAKPVGGQRQGRGGPPSARGKGRGRDRPRGPPDDPGGGHRKPPTTSH
jgi:hypothetical protein